MNVRVQHFLVKRLDIQTITRKLLIYMNSFKNILSLLLIVILISSCETNDEDGTTSTDNNNGFLILKKITLSFDSFNVVTSFTIDGRLSYREDSRIGSPNPVFEFFYDDQNRRKKYTHYGFRPELSVEYIYDATGKIEKIKEISDDFGSIDEIVTDYTYYDNTIIGTNTRNNISYRYTFTFEDTTYARITKYKVTNLETQETLFEESYEYATNGNLLKNNIIADKEGNQKPHIFEYDDKRNPWAESHKVDYLNILLEYTLPYGSLVFDISNFSPNNQTNPSSEESITTLEYNEEGYITKRVTSDTNPEGPSGDTTATFEYY